MKTKICPFVRADSTINSAAKLRWGLYVPERSTGTRLVETEMRGIGFGAKHRNEIGRASEGVYNYHVILNLFQDLKG